MSSCSVSATAIKVYVLTIHETKDGFGVIAPPFFSTDREPSPIELGQVVIGSLMASSLGFEVSRRAPEKILEYVGYKSWRAFERASIEVHIRSDGHTATLTPTKAAPGGGFLHESDHAVTCRLCAADVGSILLQMLEVNK